MQLQVFDLEVLHTVMSSLSHGQTNCPNQLAPINQWPNRPCKRIFLRRNSFCLSVFCAKLIVTNSMAESTSLASGNAPKLTIFGSLLAAKQRCHARRAKETNQTWPRMLCSCLATYRPIAASAWLVTDYNSQSGFQERAAGVC